jgi:hypothetical protein
MQNGSGVTVLAKELSCPAAETAISATVGPEAGGGSKGGAPATGLSKMRVRWALEFMAEELLEGVEIGRRFG